MARNENILEQLAQVPPPAHRRRDRIARAQFWLPVVAVLTCAGFGAAEWLFRGEARYVPGPLTHVHASWDDRCAVCHVTSQPLAASNWTNLALHQHHVADAQCQTCHGGPKHHAKEREADVPGCTSCHREHRGRDADLKRVANDRCIDCHGDLAAHVQDGATTDFLAVKRFAAGDHPEFRILRDKARDPGRIAFNHRLHLAPGLREQENTSVPFTLSDIPADFRERYRQARQADESPVKLDCSACHDTEPLVHGTPAEGLPGNLARRPRAGGETMLPIVFEQHCQACHPLNFAAGTGKAAAQPQVRHRLQPAEVHAWLRGYFTDQLLKNSLPLLDAPARPLPGKDPSAQASAKKVGDVLHARIEAAERTLFGPSTCGKCHVDLRPELGAAQRVPAADVPALWFTHARFDHTAHRAMACADCHQGVESSRTQADVLLPGIGNCLACHAPTRLGQTHGGARHDCVECHRYHAGDQPLHGRGSPLRRPVAPPF